VLPDQEDAMLSVRAVTLSAAILLGLSLALPAEAGARMMGAGQPAVKDSRLSTVNDGSTKDLRDLVNKVEQNRLKKEKTR
jgi:hypothetical protein